MKDLFISMGSVICVQNFVAGPLQCKTLQPDEVASIIATTRAEGGKIKGCFDFSSELSEEKCRRLHQFLVAFEAVTGTRLCKDDFFYECDEDGEQIPRTNYVPTVTDTCSMLVVKYLIEYTPNKDLKGSELSDRYSVSADGMSFCLFETPQKPASTQVVT